MKPILLVFTLCLLVAACKKDNQSNGSNGQVTLVVNDTTHSFTPMYTVIATTDTPGFQQRLMQIYGIIVEHEVNTYVYINIYQNLTLPGVSGINSGAYRDLYCEASCSIGPHQVGCNAFSVYLYGGVAGAGLVCNSADTMGSLNITSFSISSKLTSGNFSCRLMSSSGNSYQIVNGNFPNIPFVFQ